MRILMLQTVNTVGQILVYGQVYDIQDALAESLVKRGQAEDVLNPKTAPVPPAPVPKPEVETAAPPVEKPKPAKKPAAKKAKKAKK